MSAIVWVRDVDEAFVEARALLDTCATAHFVTTNFGRKLKLPMRTCSIPIGAINEMRTAAEDTTPDEVFPREEIRIPKNLWLADPQFHIPQLVDMLIGSSAMLSLLSIGQINLSRNNCDLYLQKTQLGWVVVGGINEVKTSAASCNLSELVNQLTRFWVIEEVSDCADKSIAENSCDTHYCNTTTRKSDERYVVRLPFRQENPEFGESRTTAMQQFRSLGRKFAKNSDLRIEYFKVMQEYIDLHHMTLIHDKSLSGYYLPHHAVIKLTSATTKVRVVFDASANSKKGISLNNVLFVGPTIQERLYAHLIRFRAHAYVLTADIEKMYRQVLVHTEDRRYQRVFWYPEDAIRVFELNSVTFGVSCAPYLAIRTIHQLTEDKKALYPRAAAILKRDLHVDDLLIGAESLKEISRIRDDIIELLKRGGFHIRQWASNHNHALDNLDEKVLNVNCMTEDGSVLK